MARRQVLLLPGFARATGGPIVAGVTFAASLGLAASVALPAQVASAQDASMFATADRCIACHQGIATSEGVGVSIGHDWRASMMANSARDPYWQAAVRREIMDYPEAAAEIEAQCSRCHMPMANAVAAAEGGAGQVFATLAAEQGEEAAALALDGVSCTVCHQVAADNLGTEASFSGGFVVAGSTPEESALPEGSALPERSAPTEGRPIFGPFEPDSGGAGIMHSATGFRPEEAAHVQSSELCASCHTLLTHAVRPDGDTGPEFPEQVPYLEWQASAFAGERSCQDCHMPVVDEDVPVTMVLGRARPDVSRHVFRGGNFFMLRMLDRYRPELGTEALPAEMALAARRTEDHLRTATATVEVAQAELQVDGDSQPGDAQADVARPGAMGPDARLVFQVSVRNLAGHKFPTGYPSRRAWLHVVVTDDDGRAVFESGALAPDGSIAGDDHDEDGAAYEPHHAEIHAPDEVQVYQSVMVDRAGAVTTGLASAEAWAKDNRLLPEGFDARVAGDRAAVRGAARSDADFGPGGDRVRYSVPVDADDGPFTISVRLRFQPIGYRWAENLAAYDAFETRRFVRYYREMASSSAITVAEASAVVGSG